MECDVCKDIVDVMAGLWGSATLDDCVFELMTYVCAAMHFQDHFVCQGLVSDFRDTFMYVITQLVHEPADVCGMIIQGCAGAIDPLNATWIVEIPGNKPVLNPEISIPNGKPILKVLHLSDIHIDDAYQVGLEADCSEMMCCRPANNTSVRILLVFVDF